MDQAFSDQLVELLPRLRRFARGLTGSREEGDDVVQAACERALARRDQFEPGSRLDSWMYRIMQTVWIDQLRKRRRGEIGLDGAELAQFADNAGVLDPEHYLGGDLRLDPERAQRALQTHVGDPLSISAHAAALGSAR